MNSSVSICNNLFIEKIGDSLMIINPKSGFGPIVIMGIALKLFLLCQQNKFIVRNLLPLLNISKEEMRMMLLKFCSAGIFKVDGIDLLSEKKIKPKRTAIWLHITNSCNLRCSYCYVNKSNGGAMSWKIAKEILDKSIASCMKHNYERLLIKFSGGEPILRFSFLKRIVNYVRSYKNKVPLKFQFLLLTNGTLINHEVIKFLRKERFKVAISMDGINQYNDRTRIFSNGLGSFNLIEKGINKLQDASISPMVHAVISDYNVNGLLEFTKFCIEKKLRFSFTPVRSESDDWTRRNHVFCEILKECYDYMEDVSLNLKGVQIEHSFENLNLRRVVNRPCAIGWNALITDHRGNLVLCQTEIGKNSLCRIENVSDVLSAVQSQNQINLNTFSKECAECLWSGICGGGCPLFKRQIYNNLTVKSPYCETYKLAIKRLLRLEAIKLLKKGGGENA